MEEKKERWLSYVAVTTVIVAVGATLSTLKVGSFSNRSILRQTQASNKWAHYQAKSIKEYLYELQKEKLEVDLALMKTTADQEAINEMKKRVAYYAEKIGTYQQEKADLKKEAEQLEAERESALLHSQTFGVAVILLQLAILLSSIAALMKKPYVWGLGLILGAVGGVYFFNGFWMFF